MVRCTSLSPPPPLLSVRALPMLSTSSMKMMDGACSLHGGGCYVREFCSWHFSNLLLCTKYSVP